MSNQRTDIQTILKITVPVIVEIGRVHKTLEQVLALAPGALIELEKHADEELSLLVNNKAIGTGVAVKVGENFGIRVSATGSPKQIIEAMSDGQAPLESGDQAGDPSSANAA